MPNKMLLTQWKKDEGAVFKGWDFSYIAKRSKEERTPWDYMRMAKALVRKSVAVLDMETGGGERFAEFAPLPRHAVAIEGYHPNVAVARKRLKPLGGKVIENNNNKLPFKDSEFDLILNRHGRFNEQICKEAFRILKPGGIILTQQVDYRDLSELKRIFGSPLKWKTNNLKDMKRNMARAGFKAEIAKEWKGKYTFNDVGSLVYYLKAIPWIVDDFSVKNHAKQLEKLQKKLERNGKLEFTVRRFLLKAKKPKK